MQKQKLQSILFRVTESALIVANTGKPFTPEGVVSLCHLRVSEKQGKPNVRYYGEDLIEGIAQEYLRHYRNPNNLAEYVGHEKGIRQDIGRFLLELLQNANDAVDEQRPTHIGAKGIGFKSILQITREPSIYSGPFSFCFSEDKTREMIGEIADGEEVPIFRIPHKCQPDDEIAELKQRYVTVIQLPFKDIEKDTEAREQTIKQLQELSAECLLFCPHLNCIKIEIQEGAHKIERELRLERDGVFGAKKSKVELTTTENGQEESKSWQQWMRIKKGISASIALPLDKGKAEPCPDKHLHVFFPSKEELPKIRALIHASFEIKSDRERLVGAEKQKNAVDICRMVKEMTEDILCSVPPKTGLLAFGKACEDEGVIGTMCQSIAEAVAETAFVPILGGGKCKPNEIKLWKNNFGDLLKSNKPEVMSENLLCGSLQKDGDVYSILANGLGAKEISSEDYFRLLQYCKNGSVEDCCNAIKFAVDKFSDDVVINEHLRKIPFWLLGANRARSYDGECPILMECLLPWPEWLRVDVLAPGFKKAFEGINDRSKLPCMPLEKEDFIEKVLVPHCDGKDQKWWRENGTKILHQASEWLKNNPDLVIGHKVGRVIHVPTKKGWIPAIECYAGSKWGGHEQFNNMEKVILPIKKWKKIKGAKKEKYIHLLKWLGVSWIPKFYFINRDVKSEDIKTTAILSSYKEAQKHWRKDDIEQFYFDDEAIMNIKDISPKKLLEIAANLFSMADKNKYYYNYQSRVHKWSDGGDSFAFHQLKNLAWLPCTPGIVGSQDQYQKPSNIYVPGKSFGGLLAEVRKGKIEDEKWKEIFPALEKLGLNKTLPDDKHKIIGLMEDLSEYTENQDKYAECLQWAKQKRGKVVGATWAIYSHYMEKAGPLSGCPIPCLRKTDKGEFMYFADSAYWLDKHYLDVPAVRGKLLEKEDINIFICSLTDGENSGLPTLSGYLKSEYECKDEVPHKTKEIQKLYNDRKLYLGAINDGNFSEDIKIRVYESICLKSEKLPDFDIDVPYETKADPLVINVSMKDNTVRALAAALASLSKYSDYKADIENFLNEENNDGCLRRLREDYGKTEESLSDIEAKQKEEQEEGEGDGASAEDNGTGTGTSGGGSGEGSGASTEDTGAGTGTSGGGSGEGGGASTKDTGAGTGTSGGGSGEGGGASTKDTGAGTGTGSGGGESVEHQKMKEDIRLKPGLFNLDVKGRKEKKLPSGDKVDVVFETDDEYVIVEVKSEISRRSDLIRGLYQCVKYRAVVNAMLSVAGKSKEVQVFLFITCKLPPWLDEKRKMLEKVAGKINIKTMEDLKQFRASTDDEQGSH